MFKSLCISLTLLIYLSANAQLQQDPRARKILDRFSDQSQEDYPVEIRFEYIYESLIDKETHIETGSLILHGDQFRLRFGESDVFCDGNTLWNHLTSAGEVYISDAEEGQVEDDFFISNPGDIFTFYRKGFKYRLKEKIKYQDQEYYEIDLYPEDLDGSYHTIKLLIDSEHLRLHSAETLGKHGVNHTVIVMEYRAKVETDENTFVFKPGEHPGIEVIDTRF